MRHERRKLGVHVGAEPEAWLQGRHQLACRGAAQPAILHLLTAHTACGRLTASRSTEVHAGAEPGARLQGPHQLACWWTAQPAILHLLTAHTMLVDASGRQ